MSKDREIKEVIQQMAGEGGHSQGLFFVADVVSASDDECVISIDGLELTGVRTGAIIDNNDKKLRVKPKAGSKVMVADLYGDKRTLMVVAFSEVDTITINGGNLGGLVNVAQLTNKLNQLVNTFNTHIHPAVLGESPVTVSVTASQAATFSKSDYEDTKIKH
jgi:hypothetical protein